MENTPGGWDYDEGRDTGVSLALVSYTAGKSTLMEGKSGSHWHDPMNKTDIIIGSESS